MIIGSITKGDIDLKIVKVPPINKKQSHYLLAFGLLLIIAASIIAIKPWQRNHPPEALDDKVDCLIGEKIVIPVLKNDHDLDSEKLCVEIIDPSSCLGVSLLDNEISYYAKKVGVDTIFYQVSDGNGGLDTAKVYITVAPKFVNIKAKFIDIYGKPMKGKYNIDIENEMWSAHSKYIIASDKGFFELKTLQENKGCKIFIEEKALDFYWDSSNEVDTVIYDPIDSIQIYFSKEYDRSINEPKGISDRFNIQFDELKREEVEYNGNIIKYGRLHFQVKIFGSNKNEYSSEKIKRELICNITQKSEDKIDYKPFEIIVGTSSSGWRTHFYKKLLKGEYGLQLMSETGKEEVYIEFEIK